MSSAEKFSAMQAFATGQTPVLISTNVVEVSVEVGVTVNVHVNACPDTHCFTGESANECDYQSHR